MPKKANSSLKTHRKPVQARAELTRENILIEARRAFAEQGFDAANIRDIAATAGVTHTMIRYHFGNKDQLWRETIRDMFAKKDEAIGVSNDDFPPLDTLAGRREYLRRYVRYCAQYPEHARIMTWETVRGGPRLEWLANEFIRPGHIDLSALLNAENKTKNLPPIWPVSLIYIIAAICQMPFVLAHEAKVLYGVDMFSDEAVDAHIDAVLTILLRDKPTSHDTWPN